MKKGIISLVMLFAITLILTGCGSNTDSTGGNKETNKESSYTFENLKSDLLALDSTTEVNEKSASLIGAEEGYGYIVGNCTVEVYKYDKKSEQYKIAEKNQQISMPSFDMAFKAIVKNGYAYTIEGSCDNVIPVIEKIMK